MTHSLILCAVVAITTLATSLTVSAQNASSMDYLLVDDIDMVGATNEKIEPLGHPVVVVIKTQGFLELGDEDLIVNFNQLTLIASRYKVYMTEDQLETLPKRSGLAWSL